MSDELPEGGFSIESLGEDSAESARQQFALLEKSLGSMREPAAARALLDETYRAAHSLKSAIDTPRMPNVDRLARRIQDVVRATRSGRLAATPQLGSLLASVARIARDALGSASAGGAEPLSAAAAAAGLEEILANPGAWTVPAALSVTPVQWARVEAARLITAGEAEADARAASAAFAKAAGRSKASAESFRAALASHETALHELREALPAGLVRVARGEPTTAVAAELSASLNVLSSNLSALDEELTRGSAVVEAAAVLGARAAQRAEAAFGSLRSVRLDAILEDLPRLVRRAARGAGRSIGIALEPTNVEVNAARAETVSALIGRCVRAIAGTPRRRGKASRRVAPAAVSRLSVAASATGDTLKVRIGFAGDAPDISQLQSALAAASRRFAREESTLEVESGKGGNQSVLLSIRAAAAATSRTGEFVLARAGDTWYAVPSSAVVECIEAGLAMDEYVLEGVRLPTLRMNDTRDPREGVVVRTPRGAALLLFDVVGQREFGTQTAGGGGAEPTSGISGSVQRPDGTSARLVDLTVLLPPAGGQPGRMPAGPKGTRGQSRS
ncbi:MAG: hypothetical protein ACLQDL_13130 [Spirochaetia bacterium]